jgi:hypothetical protein
MNGRHEAAAQRRDRLLEPHRLPGDETGSLVAEHFIEKCQLINTVDIPKTFLLSRVKKGVTCR